jgi:tungstate transport system permease protein
MDYFTRAFASALQLIIQFDAELYIVVWTSLKISIIAVVITSLFCIPIALAFSSIRFPGKGFIQNILNTLMALPTVVIGLLMFGILSRQGPLGGWGCKYG